MTAPDLPTFLTQRYDEQEAVALEAIAKRDSIAYAYPPEVPDMAFMAWEDVGVPAVLVGPEYVLADLATKRRIVEDATNQHTSGPELDWVLQVLASVFADHPDYDAMWAL